MRRQFYSHGKLLITGEYVVLDGALALAVPTKYGQSLEVETTNKKEIQWTALDQEGKEWFKTALIFDGKDLKLAKNTTSPAEAEQRLLQILKEAHKLNPGILIQDSGFNITTKLDFPQSWGLGSSSTLINNIAQWFELDPYVLLQNTFGGSGYDIAAAQSATPVTYQLTKETRSVLLTNFDPNFKDQLFFVHLNRKQDSRASISHYREQSGENKSATIEKISALTKQFLSCESLEEFKLLMEIHETLISKLIKTPKIKTSLFPDFPGAIKSLGGWGGDFVLATGGEKEMDYFRKKGYDTVVPYSEMVR
ncbi:MAG: GYDIA family GHMP kinase [Gillisia sp.]